MATSDANRTVRTTLRRCQWITDCADESPLEGIPVSFFGGISNIGTQRGRCRHHSVSKSKPAHSEQCRDKRRGKLSQPVQDNPPGRTRLDRFKSLNSSVVPIPRIQNVHVTDAGQELASGVRIKKRLGPKPAHRARKSVRFTRRRLDFDPNQGTPHRLMGLQSRSNGFSKSRE